MQGDRKEQHSSHSLNQWKERFDLQQIHAGMLTRGEPYKRGILNKEPRSLRTWFGPSPERGPGTQPTNSKWSFQFVQCIQSSFQLQFVYVTSNVFNRKVDRSMDRAMALMCSINEDNLPLLWYLGKWGKWVFCEIFRTHTNTLRLVSPWGRPGNPAYPTA